MAPHVVWASTQSPALAQAWFASMYRLTRSAKGPHLTLFFGSAGGGSVAAAAVLAVTVVVAVVQDSRRVHSRAYSFLQ